MPRPEPACGLPCIPGGHGKQGRVGSPGIIPLPGEGNPDGNLLANPGGRPPPPFEAAAAAAAAAAMDGGNPAAFAA